MQKDIRVYIAAPFFNADQIRVVSNIEYLLKANGIEYFSPRSEGVLQNMQSSEKMLKMGEIFKSNIAHMEWCTHMVAIIDNYDTGTVWEMGYGYKAEKKIVTYSDNYHGINVMLNESIEGHCIVLEDIVPAILGDFKGDKGSDVV